MKIGDEVFIHGYIDEIRKDTVIIQNDGGYFGTVQNEIKTIDGLIEYLENSSYMTIGKDNRPVVTLYDLKNSIREYCGEGKE